MELTLKIHLTGSVDVRHHFPPATPGPDGFLAQILAAIQASKETVLSALQENIASLAADDAEVKSDLVELLGGVDNLLTEIDGFPAKITQAVTDALAAANVDAQASADAVAAIDAASKQHADDIKAGIAKITAHLSPPAPPAPLALVTTALPDATVGDGYTASLEITGGTPPYSVSSSPPSDNGVSINADGSVSGDPAAAADSTFSVSVSDSAGGSTSGSVTLHAA
jgi:hypothetical protein